MGWPKKGEVCRLYQEKKDKSFLMVIVENGRNARGHYDCVGNAFDGPNPSLCNTSCSDLYLLNCCRRAQWSDMPKEWQNAFLAIMQDWDQNTPEQIRGFWKVDSQEHHQWNVKKS